jgi:hypothetical protein
MCRDDSSLRLNLPTLETHFARQVGNNHEPRYIETSCEQLHLFDEIVDSFLELPRLSEGKQKLVDKRGKVSLSRLVL